MDYTKEAEKKYGHTEAYKQSQKNVEIMGKAGLEKVMSENKQITEEIAKLMLSNIAPKNEQVQTLIAKHYVWLRNFYEPNFDIYKGLADLYINDEGFKNNFESIQIGLSQFMYDSMIHFIKTNNK